MSTKQEHLTWKDHAKRLAFDQRRKVIHCSTEPSAYISNSTAGLSLYCFRCGEREFVPHGKLSAHDILEMRNRDEEEARQPYPSCTELYASNVPTSAHLWVLQAGITPERATDEYGFGWSEKTKRVVLPVLHNGTPTGAWTARAVDGRRPKYLLPRGAVGSSWYALEPDRGPCIVVEDILSAIRIQEAGFNSLAVLGTAVGGAQAALLSEYPVYGWFDGDAAGRAGYVKLRKALGPYGVDPKKIETPLDPKAYSLARIKQYIKEVQ